MVAASTQQKLEQTLARYVAMPTVPSDIAACRAAINTLSDELKQLGMYVHIDGPVHPWLIATTTQAAMRQKRVKVLIVVHFDVVQPSSDTHFTLRTTPDKLYGRGVFDMKFAAACAKQLIQDLAQEGNLQSYDVGLLLTTDEEMGGYDGALDFLQKGWRCDIAVIPDGGWDWSIENRAKSITYLYLEAEGTSAHSSRPWAGDNPITKLAPALTQISAYFTNDDPAAVTVSTTSLETSNSGQLNSTQTPAWAKAGITIRAFTKAEAAKARAYIHEVAKTHGITKITATLDEPPVHLMRDDPLVAQFMAAAEQTLGHPPQFSDALGASDARHFAKYAIATAIMYPEGGDHHGPQEWLKRNDLQKYYSLLRTFIERAAFVPASTSKKIAERASDQ